MDVPAACAFFDKALAAGASTADAAAFLVAKEVPAFVIAESLCVALRPGTVPRCRER